MSNDIPVSKSPSYFASLFRELLMAGFLITVVILIGIVQHYPVGAPLAAIDIRVANLFYALRSASGLAFFFGATFLAEFRIIIIASLALTLVLLLKRQRVLAIGLWLALIPSEGVTYFGKLIFHRARPIFQVIAENSFSFPSGHAARAVACYGFLAYLLLRQVKTRKMRFLAIFSAVILIALADVSRLYLGVHYLSDVLAGNLVGLAGIIFAFGMVEFFQQKNNK